MIIQVMIRRLAGPIGNPRIKKVTTSRNNFQIAQRPRPRKVPEIMQ